MYTTMTTTMTTSSTCPQKPSTKKGQSHVLSSCELSRVSTAYHSISCRVHVLPRVCSMVLCPVLCLTLKNYPCKMTQRVDLHLRPYLMVHGGSETIRHILTPTTTKGGKSRRSETKKFITGRTRFERKGRSERRRVKIVTSVQGKDTM